ncbi:partial serine/threonine-protein kinase PknK, partial [Anaerolineales bacterium]
MLPLLQTKTSIPPARQNRVERPRLIEQINAGMKRAFTLILAPAGFGKTTLIAEWARTADMPVAWLSLERSERTSERFLSYFIHALQQVSPQVGQTAQAMLTSGQAMAEDAILFSLLNDLNEIKEDFAVILDDYHVLDGSEVSAILQSLLDYLPVQVHLAITTRTTPEFSLARLRARDQMVEINAADLRFTESEVRDFLEQMGAPLPPEQISHLNQSTEGWAVGLQLAGLTLARQPFDWNIPAGQAHIFDYLAEEVLRRENPEVQEFLKVSALFDRFCLQLCDHLLFGQSASAGLVNVAQTFTSARGGSKDLLAYLERANLFLVPLDSTGTWFRYHALFTEFLRRQLLPEQTAELYHAASLWFEENNLLDEAIHYATHAADHERTAALLETHYLDMIQRGEHSAVLEWLGTLPPEMMENRPRLWLAKGWGSIITLDAPEAVACAEKAEALIPPDRASDHLRGEAKALHILTQIFAGKIVPMEEISSAFSLLAEEDDFLHSMLHFNLSIHYVMLGDTAKALESFAETLEVTKSLNNPLLSIIAHVQVGEIRQMRGALGLAERAFQQVIQYARETLGERTFLLAMPFISYSDLLREQNRFDEAIRHAEQGIAFAQLWQPIASMDGQIALARIEAAQNRWDEAFARLDQAIRVAESSASVIDDTIAALQLVRLNLLRGDLSKAQHLIQVYDLEKAGDGKYFHFWEMTQLVLFRAKVFGLRSDPEPAPVILEALSTLITEAERRERVTPVIEASILSAYAHHVVAQHEAASESLSHALTLGAQCGYLRIFADEGRQLLHLIEQYRNRLHAPHAYVEEIHNLIHKELAAQSALSAVEGQQLMPLTRRELDILQLLAAGKSNQEIAEERVLTLNT